MCQPNSGRLQVLHELGKALIAFARKGQAFGRHSFQQTPGGMIFVVEESRVCGAQPQESWLGPGDQLPDGRQQPLVSGQLLNHQAYYLNSQRLAQAA